MDKQGVLISLGWFYELEKNLENKLKLLYEDYSLRVKMSQKGQQLVDGYGAKRVVEAVSKYIFGDD